MSASPILRNHTVAAAPQRRAASASQGYAKPTAATRARSSAAVGGGGKAGAHASGRIKARDTTTTSRLLSHTTAAFNNATASADHSRALTIPTTNADTPTHVEGDYISYLEAQLEKSDHERLLVIEQFKGLESHFNTITGLRTDLADRIHQLSIAQQQLSQEALLVQEEREKVARLMNENAVLTAQTDDDRAKIAALIRLRRGDLGLQSTAGLHPSIVGGVVSGGYGLGQAAGQQQSSTPTTNTNNAVAGMGYYGNHLHKVTNSTYQDRLEEARAVANGTNGPKPCIPAGHVPIRLHQSIPTTAATNSNSSNGTNPLSKQTNSMSLRSVVTDYANAHPHAINGNRDAMCMMNAATGSGVDNGGSNTSPNSRNDAPHPQHIPIPTAMTIGSPSQQQAHREDVEMAIAMQPPLNSTLVAALSAEVETLKQLLDEQRRAYEHDRARRLQDERRRHDALADKDKSQVLAIAKLQDEVQVAVKELVLYRHQHQIVERALRGEVEMLKVSCIETQRSMTSMSHRKTNDMALALEMVTAKTQDQLTKMRGEMAEKRATHFSEKESLLATIVKLREENDKLQSDVERERTLRKRAEDRCRTERQGAQSEIDLLKQHLRSIEKRIYFSHVKGERREASSAQLIAALMAQQAAAQQHMCDDGGDDGGAGSEVGAGQQPQQAPRHQHHDPTAAASV